MGQMGKISVKVGDKLQFAEESQRYTVQAVGSRWAIATKPFNARRTVLYSVIDLHHQMRGVDNYGGLGYETREECENALKLFEAGQATHSCRRRPIPLNLVAILIFACPLAFGFANVNVETKPDTIHAPIEANGNGVLQTGAVQVHSGAIQSKIEAPITAQVGSAEGPLVHAPATVTATASTTAPLISAPITTAEGTVKAPITVTTAPNTFHIEVIVPKEAVVIHAENTMDAMAKPLQEFKQMAANAGSDLWYVIMALGACVVIAIGAAIAIHVIHSRHNKQLAKGDAQ
jgi:hypothetical protein